MINFTEAQQKKTFWGLLLLLFVYCLIVTPHYGITGDEVTQWKYGNWVWKYIKTFGGDKSILTDPYVADSPLKYYGGFYDGIAAMLIDILKPKDEFLLRHYWNIVFGFAGVIMGGLLAKELTGKWRTAIIAVVFLVFTPRYFGEIFNNPKDIPFATGYLASLYCIIRWLRTLSAPSWKRTIWLGLSIALAISVRVGGILVIAYLGMFYVIEMWRIKGFGSKFFGKTVLHFIVACVIGWIGACLFWPYALEDIVNNPIEAVKVMSAYPLNITMLYEGVKIRTTEIPASYLPNWLMISTPIYIMIGFLGALALIWKWTKARGGDTAYFLVLFATLFPILYIIYKKSVVYDGVRHIMFVIPLISILAALFLDSVLDMLKEKMPVRYAVIGITVILVALPARFMLANHPNEYIYFNELAGGIKGAYGNYELDYYFNSMKEAYLWLLDNKLRNAKPKPGDTIIVASNAPDMMSQYQRISPVPFKFVYVRYYQKGETNWDYGIFMSRFLDKELLQNGYFPGDQPAHVITADGVPLTTVLENDPERNAFKAQEALKTGNNPLAVQYLTAAVKKYPKDVESWRNLAIASFQTGNKQQGEDAIGKAYAISSLDLNTANIAGTIYLQAGNFNKALQVFGKMAEDYPDAADAWLGLGQAQAALKNYPLAIDNINKALALDGRYAQQGYMALAYIYQQQGDMATAQKYAAAAQQAGGGQ